MSVSPLNLTPNNSAWTSPLSNSKNYPNQAAKMLLFLLVPMTSPCPTVYPTMVFKNRLKLIGATYIAFNRVSYILTCTFKYREMNGNTMRRNLLIWSQLVRTNKKQTQEQRSQNTQTKCCSVEHFESEIIIIHFFGCKYSNEVLHNIHFERVTFSQDLGLSQKYEGLVGNCALIINKDILKQS